jgi:hypothetical protein
MMRSSLEKALDRLNSPDDAPWPLPLAHLSIARWFDSIAVEGSLLPRRCKVFNEELLYLSYGGVFYRPKHLQTEKATELPLAFLFDPSLLDSVAASYPFDTGAMAEGKFGPEWSARFPSFRTDFRVKPKRKSSRVSDLVFHLFGTNKSYLRGEPSASCETKPDPLPLLYRFLSADLFSVGVDHRQRTIECMSSTHVPLNRSLIWIGFPDILGADLIKIYRLTKPWLPEFFAYPYHRNFDPKEIAAKLEHEAGKLIERFAALP